MKIFAGVNSIYFAEKICKNLNISLGKSTRKDFSDGEFKSKFNETVRGENVYIVQSTSQPDSNLFELLQMADAAKRCGAKNIVAVIPYLGYCRQDKKDDPRTPITSAMIAKMVEASGINHLVTMDLHNDSIDGFYNIPVSHIYSSSVLIPYIKENFGDMNFMVVAPDLGASKKTKVFSQKLSTDMAICYKYRERDNEIKEMRLIGDVKGRNVLVVDDIGDTVNTLSECAKLLIKNGANKVYSAIAHPVLSGKAYATLGNSEIKELIVTNSIPVEPIDTTPEGWKGFSKISVLDVSKLFANVIRNIEDGKSISQNL